MRLPNTKVYYKDLAHHYFNKGKMELMGFFLGLALNKENTFAKTDTNDWFASPFGGPRPEKDEDGRYV